MKINMNATHMREIVGKLRWSWESFVYRNK